jgi:hypothetical protein
MAFAGSPALFSVTALMFFQALLTALAGPGDLCSCAAMPGGGSCYSLRGVSVESVTSGRDGLACDERSCETSYECTNSGSLQCVEHLGPYKITQTGTGVCKVTRPYFTYLAMYDSSQGGTYPVVPIKP